MKKHALHLSTVHVEIPLVSKGSLLVVSMCREMLCFLLSHTGLTGICFVGFNLLSTEAL